MDAVQEQKGQVAICAFGGGPGTELLGLAKRIEQRNLDDQIVVDFLLLDRVNEWVDSWQALRHQIETRFRTNISRSRSDWPMTFSGNFCAVDVANTTNFGNLGAVFGQDIYILSYVVSEVYRNFENLRNFTANMAAHAPAGSKFLFIDRQEQCWKDEITTMANAAGITLSAFQDTKSHMDPHTEDKTDLGKIYTDVGRAPRTTWNAFWVVGTKV